MTGGNFPTLVPGPQFNIFNKVSMDFQTPVELPSSAALFPLGDNQDVYFLRVSSDRPPPDLPGLLTLYSARPGLRLLASFVLSAGGGGRWWWSSQLRNEDADSQWSQLNRSIKKADGHTSGQTATQRLLTPYM